MLSEQEAQDLMSKFIYLREQTNKSNDSKTKKEFRKHERLCIEKFKYLITTKTSWYRNFNNYDDLNQEGLIALMKGMKNYNPEKGDIDPNKKGSLFWWFHKYIGTKISRVASLHTAIRYPLKVAKDMPPHKEFLMPVIVEERYCPDLDLDRSELNRSIHNVLSLLPKEQKDVIMLHYGFEVDKPMSVHKICNTLNITRKTCIEAIDNALLLMKENIKI